MHWHVNDIVNKCDIRRERGNNLSYSCWRGAQNHANFVVKYVIQLSVPQIEYPLGGKGSHIYFLLIVTMVLLL